MTGAARVVIAAAVVVCATPAAAKRLGFSTPGRVIYDEHERFGDLVDQNRRKWVAEVVFGSAPQGNLGLTLGYLANIPDGLEFYLGFGSRTGPVVHYSAELRYFPQIIPWRFYAAGGYVLHQHPKLDMFGHTAFAELGHKWVVRPTFHFTFGVGVQRLLHQQVRSGSVLRDPDVDPEFLRDELDAIGDYRYLVSFRFSRAF